jgi:hypothetical protein
MKGKFDVLYHRVFNSVYGGVCVAHWNQILEGGITAGEILA